MIRHHSDLVQGSEAWLEARCGLLTASEMHRIITPSLYQFAKNEKCRTHLYELLGQRDRRYVEASYISDNMIRGMEDEIAARDLYSEKIAPVQQVGFITNDRWGFTLGYSPDGLVGDDGLIECKSRGQKFQFETILECVEDEIVPKDFVLQIQTGLLVSERKWCDFITYCGGAPMAVIRAFPDEKIQDAIVEAACAFETMLAEKMIKLHTIVGSGKYRLFPTERRIEQEMYI